MHSLFYIILWITVSNVFSHCIVDYTAFSPIFANYD
eukprot:UN01897